ncbi:MAG: phenylpropionate dioxygenase-like ring-hydroxylating dioxygenase large terminal subunit, partial [Flavobacteriales bacterium]
MSTAPLPTPSGWFAVGFSHDLQPSQLWSRTFCGDELVIFRTASGTIGAVHAYCPHLGAHMGRGGCVSGELLECPFHAFRFDTNGQCQETGYGSKVPPKAVVKTWPTQETNGLILVWHGHAGEAPTFGVPTYLDAGWATPMSHEFRLK